MCAPLHMYFHGKDLTQAKQCCCADNQHCPHFAQIKISWQATQYLGKRGDPDMAKPHPLPLESRSPGESIQKLTSFAYLIVNIASSFAQFEF